MRWDVRCDFCRSGLEICAKVGCLFRHDVQPDAWWIGLRLLPAQQYRSHGRSALPLLMTEARIMSCPITLSAAPARFRHVIQFSMARALQDVHVLVLAGRAFEEVIVHCNPFAACAFCEAASGRPRPCCMRCNSRPLQRIESIKSSPILGGLHHHTARLWAFAPVGCRTPTALDLRLCEPCASLKKSVSDTARSMRGCRMSIANFSAAFQELIVQSVDLTRLMGRDILLVQGSQLALGWLIVETIANRPWSFVKWRVAPCAG